MTIPEKSHYLWKELVTGAKKYEFQGLSTRILMGRMILRYELDNNQLDTLIDEVRDFFIKNEKILEKDIQKIFT